MTGPLRFATVLIAGAALALLGVVIGAWWAPFPVGVAVGAALPRARWALAAGAMAGLVAWAAPLLAAQIQFGLKGTALSIAAIMGMKGAATIPVALTLLVGVLLGLAGAWLGAAARTLFVDARPRPSVASSRPAETKAPVAIRT